MEHHRLKILILDELSPLVETSRLFIIAALEWSKGDCIYLCYSFFFSTYKKNEPKYVDCFSCTEAMQSWNVPTLLAAQPTCSKWRQVSHLHLSPKQLLKLARGRHFSRASNFVLLKFLIVIIYFTEKKKKTSMQLLLLLIWGAVQYSTFF